ncbi:hypothetical protein Btru_059011 [Bulinus truncatus]|nr:hypothetical protein Btru_059011 [Bulinus truncatus]
MSLQWKMHTNFPFTRVLVLGIFLFFLGLASMIISIIAFVTQSWGHYVGTGMWGGTAIIVSGLTAIFTSRLRSLASVKTFCISSLIAMFTSLTMLILSAGGLTLTSGFYGRVDPTEYNKRTSNLIHASLLVISVFCLSGNVLALIVCCKYIFFEHHEKPKHRRRHRNLADGSSRSTMPLRGGAPNVTASRSTGSRAPLPNDAVSRRHSDNTDVNRVQIEYRRSHRRTASDQLHSNARRQRHSHQETANGCSNNNNLLSSAGVRYYPDRRNVRGSSQGRDIKDMDRLNIQPLRNGPNSRAAIHATMQVRLSHSPITHEIRLPTEFDEEELPPYEAVESRAPADENGETASDSGDESDTENSSSTDAESYNVEYGEDGAESLPMVQLQQLSRSDVPEGYPRNGNGAVSQPLLSNSNTVSHQLVHHSNNVPPLNRVSKTSNADLPPALGATGTMIVRKDSSRSNKPVLSYINTHVSSQLGDYERLVSVSPEVCAITGESPEPQPEQHTMEENFYENGPCYENIMCVGKAANEVGLNFLSKCSSSKLTMTDNNNEVRNVGSSSRNVSRPSHLSPSTSPPPPPQSNIQSSPSAFRPVATAAPPLAQSCLSSITNSSSQNTTAVAVKPQSASSPLYKNESPTRTSVANHTASKYKEQGAIPKNIKSHEAVPQNKDKTNLSWKNILLPLSYNHSDSASNEEEKKLPPKTIPFTDSDTDISKPSKLELSSFESSKLSPRVYPLTAQNLLSSLRPPASVPPTSATITSNVSASGNVQPRLRSSDESSKHGGVEPSISTSPAPATLSVKEASTQANSGPALSSKWHSHRMGGTQSMLQSRREEMQNSQLSRRALDVSGRSSRPSSMPVCVGGTNNGISALLSSPIGHVRSDAAASSPAVADGPHPLSLRSYLVNPSQQIQHSHSLATRQNHLLQHYPMQPQQPRLGVQLHQRRHQQHQLQQNLESQQQQLQQLQQQQLQQQGKLQYCFRYHS